MKSNASDNSQVDFIDEVKKACACLTNEYEFEYMVGEDSDVVRFESDSLAIEFRRFSGHDPKVYFLTVGFNIYGKEMEFVDFLHRCNSTLMPKEVETLAASRNYPATTVDDTKTSLKTLVALIYKYGYKLFRNSGDSGLALIK